MPKAYPRTPLERSGQVNWRQSDHSDGHDYTNYTPPVRVSPIRLNNERDHKGSRFQGEPDCVIFVSKRKGFGSTGNVESDKMSIHKARMLDKSLSKERFQRYQVNIWLKGNLINTSE